MNSRTNCTREQAIAEFTDLNDRFASLAQGRTPEQLLWRPDGGKSWCIAECVEHDALANRAYLSNIQPVTSGAAAGDSASDSLHVGGWLSGLLLRSVSPEAPRKLKAPRKIRPLSVNVNEAFSKLAATHKDVISILELNPRPDFNRLRFQNPFVPLIRFTVASGILIMAAHAQRHLLQAERISTTAGFPGLAA